MEISKGVSLHQLDVSLCVGFEGIQRRTMTSRGVQNLHERRLKLTGIVHL